MSNPIKSTAAAAFLAALLACGTAPIHAATSDVKYLSVNGTELPYVEQGRGAPVIFVHGAVSDHRIWAHHVQAVANHHRAIAYTQRYFGTQAWDENGPKFGVQTHSDDLAAFIRELDAGPVHLVGWSYSGHIVLNVALRHPELVRSAFVFEPSVPSYVTDKAQLKVISDDGALLFGPTAAAVEAGDNILAVQRVIDGVVAREGYFAAQPESIQSIQLDSADTMPLLFAADRPPSISCEQLGQIQAPVAIVRGELTRPRYREIADAAAPCTGESTIVIPKAKHMWPGEDPQGFSEILIDFIAASDETATRQNKGQSPGL